MELCSKLCTDLFVIKVSLVLSFVCKTTRLIFVGMSMRVTRTYPCTTLADSKMGLYRV